MTHIIKCRKHERGKRAYLHLFFCDVILLLFVKDVKALSAYVSWHECVHIASYSVNLQGDSVSQGLFFSCAQSNTLFILPLPLPFKLSIK